MIDYTQLDYSKDIEIDSNDLENEWITQPSKYLMYSEAYADAIETKDKAKSRLEVVTAELDSKIRKDWEKLGFENKPTEPAIKAWILKHPKHKKAGKLLIKATREVNLMGGVKNAFEHRKKALENLVSLTITGFHSEPSAKKGRTAKKENIVKRRLARKNQKR